MKSMTNILLNWLDKYSGVLLGALIGMGILSGLELFFLEYKLKTPVVNVAPAKTFSSSIVTVDVTGLANNYLNELAKSNLSPEESKQQIADFSARLTGAIHAISRDEHVVVLPAQAVLAGAKDETPVVVELMKTSKDS
ncbi:MAG: TrbI F-type domain-containing protein [Legionellales bacterium]|nr:TrbI F-type domain-containing protein [Legionellales bacterium]